MLLGGAFKRLLSLVVTWFLIGSHADAAASRRTTFDSNAVVSDPQPMQCNIAASACGIICITCMHVLSLKMCALSMVGSRRCAWAEVGHISRPAGTNMCHAFGSNHVLFLFASRQTPPLVRWGTFRDQGWNNLWIRQQPCCLCQASELVDSATGRFQTNETDQVSFAGQ